MKEKSMTALISAFSRAYHQENNTIKIFNDSIVGQLLSQKEYNEISKNMAKGIDFFNPSFVGNDEQALRWIVDNYLSPTTLGRAAFAEKSLELAAKISAKQYMIFGAGHDTFAYRQPQWAEKLEIFEIDHPLTARDKQDRLKKANILIPKNVKYINCNFSQSNWQQKIIENSNYNAEKITFCSLLGVSYYLAEKDFENFIHAINMVVPKGSSIVFDYHNDNTLIENSREEKQSFLAGGAKEAMVSKYSYSKMERLLSQNGFLIFEHLVKKDIDEQYFKEYNKSNPDYIMSEFDNINYCLAVKY